MRREREKEQGNERETSRQKLGVINNTPAATKHCQCEFSIRKKPINKEGNLKQMPSEGPSAKCKMRGHPGSFQPSLCLNYKLFALDGYILIFYADTLPRNGTLRTFSPQEAGFSNKDAQYVCKCYASIHCIGVSKIKWIRTQISKLKRTTY